MRYLPDKNIISNTLHQPSSSAMTAWMSEQTDDALFIASRTIDEMPVAESSECVVVTDNEKDLKHIHMPPSLQDVWRELAA